MQNVSTDSRFFGSIFRFAPSKHFTSFVARIPVRFCAIPGHVPYKHKIKRGSRSPETLTFVKAFFILYNFCCLQYITCTRRGKGFGNNRKIPWVDICFPNNIKVTLYFVASVRNLTFILELLPPIFHLIGVNEIFSI